MSNLVGIPLDIEVNVKEFFGASGVCYVIVRTKSPKGYAWKAFVRNANGYQKVEAKAAAKDCGAVIDDANTHQAWKQLWAA